MAKGNGNQYNLREAEARVVKHIVHIVVYTGKLCEATKA